MIWMILYSFKDNTEIFQTNPFGLPQVWRFENYVNAWNQYDVPLYFSNSVIVGVATVVLTIICAMMFTFAVTRLQWKGRDTARTFVSTGQFTTDWGSMGATMVIASLPAVLVYSLFSEQVEAAMTTSAGLCPDPLPTRVWRKRFFGARERGFRCVRATGAPQRRLKLVFTGCSHTRFRRVFGASASLAHVSVAFAAFAQWAEVRET